MCLRKLFACCFPCLRSRNIKTPYPRNQSLRQSQSSLQSNCHLSSSESVEHLNNSENHNSINQSKNKFQISTQSATSNRPSHTSSRPSNSTKIREENKKIKMSTTSSQHQITHGYPSPSENYQNERESENSSKHVTFHTNGERNNIESLAEKSNSESSILPISVDSQNSVVPLQLSTTDEEAERAAKRDLVRWLVNVFAAHHKRTYLDPKLRIDLTSLELQHCRSCIIEVKERRPPQFKRRVLRIPTSLFEVFPEITALENKVLEDSLELVNHHFAFLYDPIYARRIMIRAEPIEPIDPNLRTLPVDDYLFMQNDCPLNYDSVSIRRPLGFSVNFRKPFADSYVSLAGFQKDIPLGKYPNSRAIKDNSWNFTNRCKPEKGSLNWRLRCPIVPVNPHGLERFSAIVEVELNYLKGNLSEPCVSGRGEPASSKTNRPGATQRGGSESLALDNRKIDRRLSKQCFY